MSSLSGIGPGDWLSIGARKAPHAPCIVQADGSVLTYSEMESAANRLARGLAARGVERGHRVAILATDSAEYALALFASFKLGAISVPLNFRLTSAELTTLTGLAQPRVLFYGRRYSDVVPELAAATAAGLLAISMDAEHGKGEIWSVIEGESDNSELDVRTRPDDILMWMLTSGTTGSPRAVMQSQSMIKANTVKGVLEQNYQSDDCLYAGTPLFHVAGAGWLFYALSRGASILLLPQFDADTVLRWMQSGRVTRALVVPSMAIALLEHPDAKPGSFTGLRAVAYGGSAMPASIVRSMAEVFDCDLYNTFGAGTEGGGQTILRPEDHRAALAGKEHLFGSIGKPMFGVDLKLCGNDGSQVAAGEIGEIFTRSDTVMSGFLGEPALTAERVENGWVHSGDMAWRDDEGYLFLVGRKDDLIIRGGENIHPAEIEAAIITHAAVSEAAVVGYPDPYWGQTIAAAIVTVEHATVDPDDIARHCRGLLAKFKIPDRIALLDDLPRNAAGKVQKRVLLEILQALPADKSVEVAR